MRSGLYWGAVGGMKELVAQLSELHCGRDQSSGSPQIFLTGGAAPVVAQFLDPQAAYVPSLVLSGIALVAE
jgi:pantothenate kinase type III